MAHAAAVVLLVVGVIATLLAIASIVFVHLKRRTCVYRNAPLGGVYQPVVAASTEPINWAELPSRLDGVPLENGDRVLVKDQPSSMDNGIYVRRSGTQWQRAPDMEESSQLQEGTLVFVQKGTMHRQSTWSLRVMHAQTVKRHEWLGKAALLFLPMFEHLFGGTSFPDQSLLQIDHQVPQSLVWRSQEQIEEALLKQLGARQAELLRDGAFVEQNPHAEDDQKVIPSVMHQLFGFWDTTPMPSAWLQNHQWWEATHPDFTIKLWNREMCEALLEVHTPDWLPWFRQLPKIQQADVARYFILFHEGGWYADLDCTMRKDHARLSRMVEDWRFPRFVLFAEEQTLVNYALGSVKHHPLWHIVFANLRKRVDEHPQNTWAATGRTMLTDVLTPVLYDHVDTLVVPALEWWSHLQQHTWVEGDVVKVEPDHEGSSDREAAEEEEPA